MKLVIEGEITDLGFKSLEDVKEVYLFLRNDKTLVGRQLGKMKIEEKTEEA